MQILTELPQAYNKFSKVNEKIDTKNILTHDELLKRELIDFYMGTDYLKRMSSIINGKRLSLRLLDWFVCNFSKEYFTIYMITRGTSNVRFIVYIDYKTNLDIYSKKRFAPFCRHERVYVPYDEDNYMETTIGQLNFFRWVFKNKILEYIEANYDEIKKDMDLRNNSRKRRNSSGTSDSSLEDSDNKNNILCIESVSEHKNIDNNDTNTTVHSNTISDSNPNEDVITEWVSPSYGSSGKETGSSSKTKTRKKREELSHSACKSMRFEKANITIHFG